MAPEVRLEQERNGHGSGSRSSELDLQRGSVGDCPSSATDGRQRGDKQRQSCHVDRGVSDNVSISQHRVS